MTLGKPPSSTMTTSPWRRSHSPPTSGDESTQLIAGDLSVSSTSDALAALLGKGWGSARNRWVSAVNPCKSCSCTSLKSRENPQNLRRNHQNHSQNWTPNELTIFFLFNSEIFVALQCSTEARIAPSHPPGRWPERDPTSPALASHGQRWNARWKAVDVSKRWVRVTGYILQDGAPKIATLPYKWLYGRYNYSYWELYWFINQQTYLGDPILYQWSYFPYGYIISMVFYHKFLKKRWTMLENSGE